MKKWLILVSLLSVGGQVMARTATQNQVTNVPTFGSNDSGPRSTGTLTDQPVAAATANFVSGAIKGGGVEIQPIASGVCCFSKAVIGPSFNTARKAVNYDTADVSPQIQCQNNSGTWYANKLVCPTPTPGPTASAPVGFCCYPNKGLSADTGIADTARAVSPQLLCQNNGGTWKTSGSCREVVLHPVDPLPVNEAGFCCKKGISGNDNIPQSVANSPAMADRRRITPKDRCIADPSMEWSINPCPRMVGTGELFENGVCCNSLRRSVVQGIHNSLNCKGENVWRPHATSCGRVIGDGIGVGTLGDVKNNINPPTASNSNNPVDPGANEPMPCPNFRAFDGSYTIGMCMDANGSFATHQGRNGCCPKK